MIEPRKHGPWAVIAGASEGTGAEFARQLAAAGLNLVLVSRSADKLQRLADALRAQHGIDTRTLALDLATADAAQCMVDATADLEVGLYVSNAGADTDFRPILDRPLDSLHALLAINVATVTDACWRFLQAMRRRGRGGVVVMSSVSGLIGGQPGAGVYSATKAYELALAESLHCELRGGGVDVLGVAAPPMSTPAAVAALAAAGMDKPEIVDALYRPADVVRDVLAALGTQPSLVFDFIGVEVEPGTVTAAARHARIAAVEASVAKLFGLGKG